VCNGSKESAKELAVRALHLVGDWCAINVQQQRNLEPVMNPGIMPYALQWQRPRVGWWKRVTITSCCYKRSLCIQDGADVSEMHKDLL
jgi:hypothetical protein